MQFLPTKLLPDSATYVPSIYQEINPTEFDATYLHVSKCIYVTLVAMQIIRLLLIRHIMQSCHFLSHVKSIEKSLFLTVAP